MYDGPKLYRARAHDRAVSDGRSHGGVSHRRDEKLDRSALRVHVQLPYAVSPEATRKLYALDRTPDPVAYGFDEAEELVEAITYSTDRDKGRIWKRARRAVRNKTGLDLLHAWHNRHQIVNSDVVWTATEYDYLAIVLMRRILLRRANFAILGQNIWLFNDLSARPSRRMLRTGLHHGGPARWGRRLNYQLKLVEMADMSLTHSADCLDPMKRLTPQASSKLLHFGISDRRFPVTKPRGISNDPIRVFAIGNDPTRDWRTLVEALGNDERFELLIACKWISEYASVYRNITILRDMRQEEIVEAYRHHDWVAIPMAPNRFSGMTVALEAAALGIPVLSAKTGGVTTYLNEDEALYYTPGDPVDLRRKLLTCNERRRLSIAYNAQRRFIEEEYDTRGMMRRLTKLSEEALRSRQCK